ncbi:protein of unknown function [Nitrospira japonica]|uniref:Uncharacterized protein n=1 Tax=Nitrospira japonica TaxID=1325564 RepID=A0A1W1I860_9BACT|nr:protein of unknown function [Nitrospira japonica]
MVSRPGAGLDSHKGLGATGVEQQIEEEGGENTKFECRNSKWESQNTKRESQSSKRETRNLNPD